MGEQKKAVVVGGSNGIGLALTLELICRGYHVIVADKAAPEEGLISCEHYTYMPCDLRAFNRDMFENLSADKNVEILLITAGFGRIAEFEYLHTSEIEALMEVNATSCIKIASCFYHRIKDKKPFYCGMMGSIAGLVSSPLFSVYAASKAAVCRFIESVNIELEQAQMKNRILNVSPGSFRGSRFNGGNNQPELLACLSTEIVNRLFLGETLFIPDYEKTYKAVLERYQKSPHNFGLESCRYKLESGRVSREEKTVIGYLSGTFDLFHVGHLNLIRRAKQHCDYLIVGVHKDASHKGKETYIPFDERMEIVGACRYVDKVVESCREDSDAWDRWHFHRLFVGSDYKGTLRFQRYEEYFKDKNAEIIYFPYTQGTSSTHIRGLMDKK